MPSRVIVFDTMVHIQLHQQAVALEHDIDELLQSSETIREAALRAVQCRRCGACVADDCQREAKWCDLRENDARARLRILPTWALEWRSPCCDWVTHLAWRQLADWLVFEKVPCGGCGEKHDIAFHQTDEDVVERRVATLRVQPHLVQTLCWGQAD